MAIKRVGPPSPAPQPHRQNLGFILVTIDDLRELIDLVQPQMSKGSQIEVEFDGGTFTDAEDLRALNDSEIGSLKLKTPDVEIILSTTLGAVAIGSEAEATQVYNLWARTKQKQVYGLSATIVGAIGVIGFSLAAGVAGAGVTYALDASLIETRFTVLLIAVPVGLLLSRRRAFYYMMELFSSPTDYVTIVPYSRNEYRTMQINSKYPRLSWIITTISVAVAIAAIVVNVLSR